MRFKRIRSVTAKSSIQGAVAAVASSLSDTMSSMLMQASMAAVDGGTLQAPFQFRVKLADNRLMLWVNSERMIFRFAKSKIMADMQRRAWGRYTPAQREARIRKMLAGRGITRKSKVKA